MKLIIFDIDGTILDSVNADDKCFIKTFKDLFKIDLTNVDWNDFKNVTDTGLTIEIFQKWFNREPKKEDIENIKSYFKSLLINHTQQFTEIEKSLSFIKLISIKPDFEIGFATGGWKETAELKCNSVGLNLNDYIFKSSNDHYKRGEIIEFVIKDALKKNNVSEFESITYFGDGLWDYKTTQTLGIDFIGVDFKKNRKLKNMGVEKVIANFVESEKILNWINKKT
ncbi:HAD family hydrolase [Aquimarina mycalae]|uniref:HAD family hydrolase n=1 Tax=Aquimarina mycalae TaxID=3040073 RepID=UPI002477DAD5|nr:HAD hydrolase-like protein [Aquimarina sp. 2201CG14-23]MDH7447816.1 HAD hydrolase-like protein [Aquimarina sp. 2201CG14-23]